MTSCFNLPWHIERFTSAQSYRDVLTRQLHWVEQVAAGHPPVLMLGEHPPVYTVGRKVRGELPERWHDTPVIPVARGGEWTWHGPGQLVVYPIVPVATFGGALGTLRWLEAQTLDWLHTLVVDSACLNPPHTGVWLTPRPGGPLQKVASLGIAVRRGVAFHGVAINVDCDLSAYQRITPCGLPGEVMTSLNQASWQDVTIKQIEPIVLIS